MTTIIQNRVIVNKMLTSIVIEKEIRKITINYEDDDIIIQCSTSKELYSYIKKFKKIGLYYINSKNNPCFVDLSSITTFSGNYKYNCKYNCNCIVVSTPYDDIVTKFKSGQNKDKAFNKLNEAIKSYYENKNEETIEKRLENIETMLSCQPPIWSTGGPDYLKCKTEFESVLNELIK